MRHLSRACTGLVGAVLLLTACGSDPPKPPELPKPPEPPKPTLIEADIVVSPAVNPDIYGRPSPIVARLYELKSLSTFNSADFFVLYDKDVATLGPESLAREVLELKPGERRQLRRELSPEARFLGVIAAYRDLEHAQWRAAVEIPAHETTLVTLRVDRSAVSMAAVRRDPPAPAPSTPEVK